MFSCEPRPSDQWMYLQQDGSSEARARRGHEYEILRKGLQGFVQWPPLKKAAPMQAPAPPTEAPAAPAPVQEPAPLRRSERIRERAARREA